MESLTKSVNDHTFIDSVKRIKKSVYNNAIEQVITHLSGSPVVCSVYQIGEVGTLGISDLDLIVVVTPDSTGQRIAHHLDVRALPDESLSYVMTHGVYPLPPDIFRRVRRFYHLTNITRVYGAEIEILEPDADAQRLNRLNALVSFLVSRLIRCTAMSRSNQINVRQALLLLHSLNYTVSLAKDWLNEAPAEWEEYLRNARNLRAEWFELGDEKYHRLLRLLSKAATISNQIARQLAPVLAAQLSLIGTDGRAPPVSLLLHSRQNTIAFVAEMLDPPEVIDLPLLNTQKKHGRQGRLTHPFDVRILSIPNEFYFYYATLSHGRGPVSREIRSRIYPKFLECRPAETAFARWLQDYRSIVNQEATFLQQCGLEFGTLWEPTFYRTRAVKPRSVLDTLVMRANYWRAVSHLKRTQRKSAGGH